MTALARGSLACATVALLTLSVGAACRHGATAPPSVAPAVSRPSPPRQISEADVPADVRRLLAPLARPDAPPSQRLMTDVPEAFPRELIPPGASVAAALTSETAATAVAVAKDFTLADRASEQQRLIRAGWQLQGLLRSGFISSVGMPPVSVCRGEQFSSTTFASRSGGGSLVRIAWSIDPRRPCRPTVGFGFTDLDVPVLLPPAGARVTPAAGGGGTDRIYSQAFVDTTMGAPEIAEAYRSQLEDTGWNLDGQASGDGLVAMRFGTTSRIGDAVTAVLVVNALKDAPQFEITFTVVRNLSARGRVGGVGILMSPDGFEAMPFGRGRK